MKGSLRVMNFLKCRIVSLIHNKNEISTEIGRRINKHTMESHSIQNFCHKTNCTIYKTLVRPVVTYGLEMWTLNMKEANAIGVFKIKILRAVFGAIQKNNEYRQRLNYDLYEEYADENIISPIKRWRLRWLDHIIRMHGTRMPLKILNSNPIGKEDLEDRIKMDERGWNKTFFKL